MNHNNGLAQLTLRVSAIEERNRRVELEKAWQVSRTRNISTIALTYLVTTSCSGLSKTRSMLCTLYSHPRILSFYGIAPKGKGMVAKFVGFRAVAL